MSFYGMILLGLSLSMDAFSIAVCNGIAHGGSRKQAVVTALAFGLAQAIMPVIGYLLGSSISNYIASYDHWVAFALLAFIGGSMLWDGISQLRNKQPRAPQPLSLRMLITQAVATSLDALAVGISLAALHVNIITASATIGVTTFLCCVFGATVGARFGRCLGQYAVVAGGLILVLIGLKILLSHLGVL